MTVGSPEPQRNATASHLDWREKRQWQRDTNRARNRLLSVQHDVDLFLKPLLRNVKAKSAAMKSWPLVANLRCGAWYTGPLTKMSCYFKSADGHVGTWNFSLKRLNLPVVSCVAKSGGCWVIDASRSKELPDSLSRTIPIWAAVMNRIVARFRRERGILPGTADECPAAWDEGLYTPDMIASEEHETILNLLNDRVEALYSSKVIVRPEELLHMMKKPLRPVWITSESPSVAELERLALLSKNYFLLVCVCCHQSNIKEDQLHFPYSAGASDDEESWARGLTPQLFWKHHKQILKKGIDCDACDQIIDEIVLSSSRAEDGELHCSNLYSHRLGLTEISIGSRRAGRPPTCWDNFDAVLNVTTTEYEEFQQDTQIPENKYYLQLPVEEGKRDRTELEQWLAVGVVFIVHHASEGRRVLIHCAQGRDRSATLGIAVVALFCRTDGRDLQLRPGANEITTLVHRDAAEDTDTAGLSIPSSYGLSGLPNACVDSLLGRCGRDLLLEWFRSTYPDTSPRDAPLATKETLRIALHEIQRYRTEASPSRSSMQKLNRFFMSATYTTLSQNKR